MKKDTNHDVTYLMLHSKRCCDQRVLDRGEVTRVGDAVAAPIRICGWVRGRVSWWHRL
jgi:hypothetical protein